MLLRILHLTNLPKAVFDLIAYGKKIDHIQLNVAGIHNVSNALAAIASCTRITYSYGYHQERPNGFLKALTDALNTKASLTV